jgi:SNF2 family DNA or RNA helicase
MITSNAAGGTHTYQKVVRFKNLKELGELIKDHSYRILKKDCLDLPDKVYAKREVELSDEQKEAYKDMKADAITVLKGQSMTALNVLTQLIRLHQITCGHMKTDSGQDRAHRIGQKNKVLYIDLVARGTVDEKIIQSLRNKVNIANEINGEELISWI